jgi:hypothetical protein
MDLNHTRTVVANSLSILDALTRGNRDRKSHQHLGLAQKTVLTISPKLLNNIGNIALDLAERTAIELPQTRPDFATSGAGRFRVPGPVSPPLPSKWHVHVDRELVQWS